MDVLVDRRRTQRLRWLIDLALVMVIILATAAPAFGQVGDQPRGTGDMLSHIISSAGIIFGPILLLVSISLAALIVLLTMDLRLGTAVPPGLVDLFTDNVGRRQFQQAYEACRSDSSFLARVLSAGLGRLQYGIEDARQAANNMLESVRASKEQLINYLGTIGTLGPMIGLVGTVFGMIQSFMELSRGGAPKSEELAKGISHALVVTLLGVAISVPAIFCYTFFRNRLVRITMETGTIADDLLTQLHHRACRDAEQTAEPSRLAS